MVAIAFGKFGRLAFGATIALVIMLLTQYADYASAQAVRV